MTDETKPLPCPFCGAQTNPFTESFKATLARYDDLPDGHKTDYERYHAPAPVTVDEHPTFDQLNDACLSYDHSYGLMSAEEREHLRRECADWWRCIARALAGQGGG